MTSTPSISKKHFLFIARDYPNAGAQRKKHSVEHFQ